MAKLLAPYSLCPLIEQRRFLGVSEDSSSGCVIVTLGRNIVIRYRLSDQKQVSSWSSRSKLTAPVVYDYIKKNYIGVFGNENIGFWHDNFTQLDKIRKFRFSWLIHSILSKKDCPPMIVYRNGQVGSLETDFHRRKNLTKEEVYFDGSETVKTAKLVTINGEHYISIQTSFSEENKKKLHFLPVDPDRGTRFEVNLHKKDVSLSAFAVVEGDSPQLLTLWSDGKLCSDELPARAESQKVLSNVTCVNTTLPVAILPIEDHHIVLYGAAPNSEGAYLNIMSLKFGLPEASQRMKVYDPKCRMWLCKNDILVVCGSHLVVTPYRLGTTRLISLLGVGKTKINEEETNNKMDVDQTLKDIIEKLKSEGKPDHSICDQVMPNLLEKKDKKGMLDMLNSLIDIPDRWLIEILIFSLDSNHDDVVDRILGTPLVGDESSLGLIKRNIKLESVLKLLKVISDKLDNGGGTKCLLDWTSLLLDSHYQQYILSKNTDVIDAVKAIQQSVKEFIESLAVLNELKAEINSLKKGKIDTTKLSISYSGYTYEKFKLY